MGSSGPVFEHKMVIAVRKDLRLGPGKLAVQVAHAAVTLATSSANRKREEFERWLVDGQKKVVVKVEGIEDLFVLQRAAQARKLPTALIQDAGLTEVAPGTVTCLGIGPARSGDIDPLTGGLPLA